MGIFEELKTIGKILMESGKTEQYQQILDAQSKLLEMQKRISELEEQNIELQKKLQITDNLRFERNAYWLGENKDGPFCTRCWDKNKEFIRMKNERDISFNCPECKNKYRGPKYDAHVKEIIRMSNDYR